MNKKKSSNITIQNIKNRVYLKKIEKSIILKNTVILKSFKNCIQEFIKNNLLIYKESKNIKLYDFFLFFLEKPLFESLIQHTRGNQTKAASILGINRGTFRKKLKQYSSNSIFTVN